MRDPRVCAIGFVPTLEEVDGVLEQLVDDQRELALAVLELHDRTPGAGCSKPLSAATLRRVRSMAEAA